MSSLSRNIFSGASWMVVQTLGTKLFSFIAQIILAWILLPEDFGKISLTFTITNIGLLIQSFGLSDVLISRRKSYYTLLPLARTISLVAAVICFVITVLLGFLGGLIYQDEQIPYLVLIYCLAIPFNAFSVVSDAKLRIDLRFRNLSTIHIMESFLIHGGTILLAALSFGVYSFVIPPVITSVLRCVYLYHLADISMRFSPTLRHWGHLVVNSFWGFIHQLVQRIILQADYAILGLYASKSVVGLYYMAYSLSVQVIALLTGNLAPVLFPTLMRAQQENVEIRNVLKKSTVFLAMLGIPFAFWQGVSAAPLIKIFLPDKYLGTIQLVEILSIGMGFRVVSSLWAVALRLQSQFKTQAYYSTVSSIIFIFILIPLSKYFQAEGTALAISLFYVITSPLLLYFSFKTYTISFKWIISVFVKYSLLGIISFLPIYFASKISNNIWGSLTMNGIISPIVYVFLLKIFSQNELNELIDKFFKGVKREHKN